MELGDSSQLVRFCAFAAGPYSPAMTQEFTKIFKILRPLYNTHADKCVVLSDNAFRYYLGTHEVREKDGYRTGFGGVEIKKNYVSAHLMPIYVHPDMLEGLSMELRKRMQGKSCFNFNRVDAVPLDELANLISAGVSRFDMDGRL